LGLGGNVSHWREKDFFGLGVEITSERKKVYWKGNGRR